MNGSEERLSESRLKQTAIAVFTCVVLPLNGLVFVREITNSMPGRMAGEPGIVDRVLSWAAPLRSVNGYGLFRVMTTERPEIVIEGSTDGVTWVEYEFRWKAGDIDRPPRFCTPHMPRLDWQMWFAALNPRGNELWLIPLIERLLDGTPEVVTLLEANPFPDEPPRYIRLVYYQYHFTSSQERSRTGAWWQREWLGELTRPLSQRDM